MGNHELIFLDYLSGRDGNSFLRNGEEKGFQYVLQAIIRLNDCWAKTLWVEE